MFSINNNPLVIIKRQATKEFKEVKFKGDTYTSILNSLITVLRADKKPIKEHKLETEQEIHYLELHNFDNFVSIRLAQYAYVFAIISMILFDKKLQATFGFTNLKFWISLFIAFGIFMVITSRKVSDRQKEQLIYLKFKLLCIEKISKN